VLGLYAVFLLVIHLPAFPLREVRVLGDLSHVTREQVEATTRRHLAGNFFTVDIAGTRRAFERLPWVRRVEVRRRLAVTGLHVFLEEHVALARWGDSALVNTHGEAVLRRLRRLAAGVRRPRRKRAGGRPALPSACAMRLPRPGLAARTA
jgi:cell division septal protein FtsQ